MFRLNVLIWGNLDVFFLINESEFFFKYHWLFEWHHKSRKSTLNICYFLLFLDTVCCIIHILDLFSALSKSFDFFETTGTVVNLSILPEYFSLLHHILDILVDGNNPVKDIFRSISSKCALCIDHSLVLLDFLFYVDESFLDPI